jgi:hypothetical protein
MTHAHCTLNTQGYRFKHSGCVTLIAFPQQKWGHERASELPYTYIVYVLLSLRAQTEITEHREVPTLQPTNKHMASHFVYQQMHFLLSQMVKTLQLKHCYTRCYMFRSVRTILRKLCWSLLKITTQRLILIKMIIKIHS